MAGWLAGKILRNHRLFQCVRSAALPTANGMEDDNENTGHSDCTDHYGPAITRRLSEAGMHQPEHAERGRLQDVTALALEGVLPARVAGSTLHRMLAADAHNSAYACQQWHRVPERERG